MAEVAAAAAAASGIHGHRPRQWRTHSILHSILHSSCRCCRHHHSPAPASPFARFCSPTARLSYSRLRWLPCSRRRRGAGLARPEPRTWPVRRTQTTTTHTIFSWWWTRRRNLNTFLRLGSGPGRAQSPHGQTARPIDPLPTFCPRPTSSPVRWAPKTWKPGTGPIPSSPRVRTALGHRGIRENPGRVAIEAGNNAGACDCGPGRWRRKCGCSMRRSRPDRRPRRGPCVHRLQRAVPLYRKRATVFHPARLSCSTALQTLSNDCQPSSVRSREQKSRALDR